VSHCLIMVRNQKSRSRLLNLLSNNFDFDAKKHMEKVIENATHKNSASLEDLSNEKKKSRARREVRLVSKNLNLGEAEESQSAVLKPHPIERPELHHTNNYLASVGERDPVISRLLHRHRREDINPKTFQNQDEDVALERLPAKNFLLTGSGVGDPEKVSESVVTSTELVSVTKTDDYEEQLIDIDDSIEFRDYNSESYDYNSIQSPNNDEYDDYYDDLLNSLNGDDLKIEDLEMNDDEDYTIYRDFPIGTGYVSIPIQAPGLNISFFQDPPSLKLWTAEEAFKQQVIPTLYMLVPAALLGFIIGMSIWLIVLIILRTYTSIRKSLETRKDTPQDDLIKNLNYTLSKDPWKKISDAETVHGLDGSMKKRDRIWHLRQEGRRGIGGSDRKPRPIRRDDSRVSSHSAGKDMKY